MRVINGPNGNYNIYKKNTEYDWHIDAELEKPLFDIKLTCLLNCSDGPYEGGNLYLFSGAEFKIS